MVMEGGGGSRSSLPALQLVAEGEVLIGLTLNDLDLFILILALFLLHGGGGGGRGSGGRGRGPVRLRCGGRGNVHRDRGNSLAGGRASVDGNIRLRRGSQLSVLGDTKDLIDVDVAAVLLDLRVVDEEGILISSVLLPDGIASVARDDNDGVLAVDLGGTKADFLTRDEVAATLVDDTSVQGAELVGRGLVGSGNGVTVVASLDGVLASTISSESTLEEKGESKGNGGFSEHGGNRQLGGGRLRKTTARFNQERLSVKNVSSVDDGGRL